MYMVLTLCLLLFVYALYSWNKRNASGHKLPPALPGGLPIIGHFLLVLYWVNDLQSFLNKGVEFCLKSGGIISGSFLGRTYYGVTDFDDAVTIANAFSEKHYFYRFAEPWFGKGLITASGAIYHIRRKLLNPVFNITVTHRYIDVFNNQSRQLTEILDGFAGQGSVDPSDAFRNIALRTSCITTFGELNETVNDFTNKYILATNNSIELIRDRLLNILLHNDFLYRFSTQKKKLDLNVKFINEIIQKAIQKKKEEMKNIVKVDYAPESDTFRSFLDIMVELAADGALSDKEIIDELNTIATASFDTTGQQLAYIAVLLGSYPDKQIKVYNEIMEVIGDRDISKQDLSKLVYTEAFIKECMRIRTVINILPRYADRDLKLKNYTLRAGSYVILLVDGLHRDPRTWGSDVNEFRPERWLNKEKQINKVNFAFSNGQRICVGKKYAMVSMKIAVAHIVRKFRLKGDFSKIKFLFDVVIRPKSGLEVTFERRNTT